MAIIKNTLTIVQGGEPYPESTAKVGDGNFYTDAKYLYPKSTSSYPCEENGTQLNIALGTDFEIGVTFTSNEIINYRFYFGGYTLWDIPAIYEEAGTIVFSLSKQTQSSVDYKGFGGLGDYSNKKVFVKLVFSGGNSVAGDVFIDGENVIHKVFTGKEFAYNTQQQISFGVRSNSSWYPRNSVIDLRNTYIKKNGVLIWGNEE